MGINDFYQISDWTADMHNDVHRRDVAWLNAQVADLEQSDVNIIIFSHWSPSQDTRAIDPKHMGSSITSGFFTDMSQQLCFKSAKVKLWAFGHTHYNCDLALDRAGDAGPLGLLPTRGGIILPRPRILMERRRLPYDEV